jgi:signal transduction histidine kinase
VHPAGGSIELSAIARNRSVDISVTDTGVGIPPDAAGRIFEPF